MELEPKDYWCRVYLGHICWRTNLNDEAPVHFEAAAEILPSVSGFPLLGWDHETLVLGGVVKPLQFRLLLRLLLLTLAAGLATQGRDTELPDRPGASISVTERVDGLSPDRYVYLLVDGTTYKSTDKTLSLEEVMQIRESILRSEHEQSFEGIDLAGVTVDEATGWEERFSLIVALGGDPNIKLSCQPASILTAYEEPNLETLPNWIVKVGDRSWTTRSRNVSLAASKLCRYPGVPQTELYSLERYFENMESPLRESIRDWNGFSELNRKLKLIEIREAPTAVHFVFKARNPGPLDHVTWSVHSPENDDNRAKLVSESVAERYRSLAGRHGYHDDPADGLNPDWRPLLKELEIAEKLIPRFGWIERLRDDGLERFSKVLSR